MARFYGTLKGRLGGARTAADPEYAVLNGWNSGVMVIPREAGSKKDPVDSFEIWATQGSNGNQYGFKIGVLVCTPSGPVFIAEADRMTENAAEWTAPHP